MKKKVIIISLLILAILGGIRVYYWIKPVPRSARLLRAVPVNAAFFLEMNKLSKLDEKLSPLAYYNGLKQLPFFKKTQDLFTTIAPIMEKQKEWKNALYNKTVITSFHLTRADNFDVLLVIDLSGVKTPDFPAVFGELNSAMSFNKRDFNGQDVYDIYFFHTNKNLTIAYIDGALIISSESYLVEDAVAQMAGKESLFEQEDFVKLEKASSPDFESTLYFNYKQLAQFMAGFANVDAPSLLNGISNFSDWSQLNLTFQPQSIQFSGNTITASTNWLSWLTNGTIQTDATKKIAPDNAAILLQLGLSAEDSFINHINPAINGSPDFQHYVRPWLGPQMGLLMVEPIDGNFMPQSFLTLGVKNEAIANKLLGDWALIKASGNVEQTIYKGTTIKRLNIGDALDQFYKNQLIHITNPYYVVIENQAVFSNSLTQLKLLLDKYADGHTLAKKATTANNGSANGQMTVYIDLGRMKDFFRAMGSDSLVASLSSGFDVFRQFSPLQLTYKADKDLFRTTATLNFNGAASSTEAYLWKATLDTTANMAPQVVYSANGQDKLVAVQDVSNQLYLLNKGGDIVWKKMLDGPLMGNIYQFDFYSNGEQEMVFATTGKIYLLKMDGTSVGNFPVTLSAKATGPLSVLDFDGIQQYRFFIPCNNGSIYGFDKSGKPLSGWNPNAGTGLVTLPIEFYKAANKEFLIAVGDNGSLLFFNRDGRRVANEMKLKTRFTWPFLLSDNSLCGVDTSGRLFQVGMDGKLTETTLPVGEPVRMAADYNAVNDSAANYILLSRGKLIAFRSDTSLLFSYNFSSSFPRQLLLINDPLTKQYVTGVVDTLGKQAYLFDNAGKLYKNFPKPASTGFALSDLFSNGVNVLVTVVNGREVIAYGL